MKKYENPSSYPNAIDPLIFFQDIDIPHQEAFETFRGLIAQGRYNEAIEYINQVDDADGYFADLYNLIIKRVYNLQYHLLETNSKFIYSTTTPKTNYPYLHNGIIWFNYNKDTKAVAPNSRDIEVNEELKDNMVIRRVDSITPNGAKYDIEATVPSNKLCYEDIYLDELTSLKEDFEETVDMDPIWYTDRTYYRGEEIVWDVISDGLPERKLKTRDGFKLKTKQGEVLRTKTYEDYVYDPPQYYLYARNGDQIKTRDGKAIRLYPYEATVSLIFIYGMTGKLLKKIELPKRGPVLKDDPNPYPELNSEYIHTKFRIMANLPTLLWHRLSFITAYTDTIVSGNQNIKGYLDSYKRHVDTNIPRLLAPANTVGVSRSSVNNVSELLDTLEQNMGTLTDTIKSITGEGDHLNSKSMPKEVALFILYQMYSPIIDATFRFAARKGLQVSDTYTIKNAIHILKQLVVLPLYVTDANGNRKKLVTRDGKIIKLRYGSEEEP